MMLADPLWRLFGHHRVEQPVAATERVIKKLLFDCQMCGQCMLSSSGMSCPMNCPKNLRNGPCGGVRNDGCCEVEPSMQCVWVGAWDGSAHMKQGDRIKNLQPPINHSIQGTSSWLMRVRELGSLNKHV